MGQRSNRFSVNYYQEELAQLFIKEIPLVDLRSPGEFQEGSFPNAINLPLMTDDERHLVGLCYKEKGQPEAIKLGHSLVSGKIKDERVNLWIDFVKESPNAIFFCFRGGLRSQTVQSWLKEAGLDVPIIEGGYKVLRNLLLSKIDELSNNLDFLILSGNTGARKTEIINELDGLYSTIDLEGLANHRGSAFGYNLTPQPTQIDFENSLSVQMLKIFNRPKSKFVIIEDESRRIGRVSIPNSFFEKKKTSPVFLLEIDLDTRTKNTRQLYVENLWAESDFSKNEDYD